MGPGSEVAPNFKCPPRKPWGGAVGGLGLPSMEKQLLPWEGDTREAPAGHAAHFSGVALPGRQRFSRCGLGWPGGVRRKGSCPYSRRFCWRARKGPHEEEGLSA